MWTLWLILTVLLDPVAGTKITSVVPLHKEYVSEEECEIFKKVVIEDMLAHNTTKDTFELHCLPTKK